MFWIIFVPLVLMFVFVCLTFLESERYKRRNQFDSVFDKNE